MFKFIKFIVGLVVFGAFVYLVVTVPFGEKTLFQHAMGISQTNEAQNLGREVSKKIEDAAVEVKDRVSDKESTPKIRVEPVKDKGSSVAISDQDKQALKRLLSSPDGPSSKDRAALEKLLQEEPTSL